MSSPVLAFANYTKDFLLKIDASKEGLGVVFSQKQADRHYHPVAYGSQALTAHEKNYNSTKLEFLALKWAITEHFKEYLLYQPFLVKTENNPLFKCYRSLIVRGPSKIQFQVGIPERTG